MNNPEKLSAETESVTASRVRQSVYFPATEEKMPLLLNLMASADVQRSIVFVNTKVAAERVTTRLERHGFRVGALSGDVPQKKRQKLLERFQRGEVDVLVATDVAARGLHIPAVSHVFNYDLPHDPEDYVHRIGRTARLGAEGDAISFACDLYAMGLPDIERFIAQKIPVATVTRELLVPPPKRERVAHPSDAQNAADDAADAADEVVVPSTNSDPNSSKRRRRRSGGRGRGPKSGGAAPAAPAPDAQ